MKEGCNMKEGRVEYEGRNTKEGKMEYEGRKGGI
jgi:hypothetical protein